MFSVKKKVLYYIITGCLILLLCFITVLKPQYKAEVCGEYGADRLAAAAATNYEVSSGDDAVSFSMTEAGSRFEIPVKNGSIDAVLVHFTSVDAPFAMRMEYGGEGLVEKMAVGSNTAADPLTYTFLLVDGEYDHLRFCFEGSFSISGIEVAHTVGSAVTLNINLIPAALLFLIVVSLILLERWIGYFGAVAKAAGAFASRVSADWHEKRLAAIFRFGAALFTALWAVAAMTLICTRSYSRLTIIAVFALAVLAVLFQFAHRIFGGGDGSAASMFLMLTLILGVTIAVLLPTSSYVTWDDETHLHRIMEVVSLNRTRSLAEQRIFGNGYASTWFIENPGGVIRLITLESALPGGAGWRWFNPYAFLGYLPAAVPLFAARVFRSDLVVGIILGRVATALAYGIIIWFGLKKVKSGAYIVSTICLLPSALFLAGSYSYDPWLIAWVAYGFCYMLSEWQDPMKKLTAKDLVLMDVALLMACGPKAIYFLLFLPLFFFKKDKFASPIQRKRFLVATVCAMALILASFMLPFVVNTGSFGDARGGSGISAAGQVKFILSQPFEYAGILLKFLGFYVSGQQMQGFNNMFGYLGSPHVFWGTLSALLIIYAACTDRKRGDNYENMRMPRLIGVLSALITLVCAATALYVDFTPVGYNTVLGFQFRYIFPILIPLALLAVPGRIHNETPEKRQSMIVFGLMFVNIAVTFAEVYLLKL